MAKKTNNLLEDLLKKITKQYDDLDSLRGTYMADCKGPRGKIKDILAGAKEADYNMTAVRELVREHLDNRKKTKRIAAMEQDDISALDEMIAALGDFADTELGGAAVRRAQNGDALNSLQ